jgi:hypothetical protein
VHSITETTHQLIRVAVTGVLAFSLLGTYALAAPPVREQSLAASAGDASCDASGCTRTDVYVVDNDGSGQVCVGIARFAPPPGSEFLSSESGCAPLTTGAFSLDAKTLETASLAATAVTLESFVCSGGICEPADSRTVTVAGTWSGVGDVATFRTNSKATYGTCTYFFGGNGASREASAAVTVDTVTLTHGYLYQATAKSKLICR